MPLYFYWTAANIDVHIETWMHLQRNLQVMRNIRWTGQRPNPFWVVVIKKRQPNAEYGRGINHEKKNNNENTKKYETYHTFWMIGPTIRRKCCTIHGVTHAFTLVNSQITLEWLSLCLFAIAFFCFFCLFLVQYWFIDCRGVSSFYWEKRPSQF